MPLIPAQKGWRQEARALRLLSPTQSVSPRSQCHKHLRNSTQGYSSSFTHVHTHMHIHTHICMHANKEERQSERKEGRNGKRGREAER